MALRKLMEPGNLQDKTTHAVTPSKEGSADFLTQHIEFEIQEHEEAAWRPTRKRDIVRVVR